jgi:hypothetical protein
MRYADTDVDANTPKTGIGDTASQFFVYYYLNTIYIRAPTVSELFFAFFTTSPQETVLC